MATKALRSLSNLPGLEGDTYTIAATDTTLAVSGEPADAKAAGDAIAAADESIRSVMDIEGKTVFSGNVSGTRSVSTTLAIPAGAYIVSAENVTSTDTDATTCLLVFMSGSTEIGSSSCSFSRDQPGSFTVTTTKAATRFICFASDNYAHSANDTFTFTGLKISNPYPLYNKINELDSRKEIQTPAGFDWADHPLAGHLFRTESGIVCDLDVRAEYRPKAGKTYWVSPNGDDSNAGNSSSAPLQSIATAIGKGDAAIIRLMDGYFDGSLVPGHISGLSQNLAIVANDNAHPVIGSSTGASTWAQAEGQTYTYQTEADSNAVWDIANSRALDRVDSISAVESKASTYYSDGTQTYVHTADGSAPTSDIRCCIARDNFRFTASDGVSLYFEDLTIVGGDAGALRVTADGTNRAKVYAQDCTFIGAAQWGACYLEGCEAVLQGCEATGSKSDGFGIHKKTNALARHIEINCKGHHNGVTGNTTSNGSTVHDAAYVIRVNGEYHHNVGPNVADVQNGTQSWCINCHAWRSLIGTEAAGNSDFLPSDGTATMWLDSCSGYGSLYSLYVNSSAKAYVRGGAFETIKVNATGHMESY